MALKTPTDLYDMELHEIRMLPGGGIEIVRVPGGWIYNVVAAGDVSTSTFVPFDNEFQPR